MGFSVQIYNSIHPEGLSLLQNVENNISIAASGEDADAILLRSFPLTADKIDNSVLAVARAGAGTNNIDLQYCTEQGIVVFNTPGANANAVTELVLCSMLMASRKIPAALNFMASIDVNQPVENFHRSVEAEKKRFSGRELREKSLGIIGLGAIGSRVAELAHGYGIKVFGFDPNISIENAWRLPSSVVRCESMNDLLSQCDFVSIHVPLLPQTKDLIGEKEFAKIKKNAVLLNFARAPIVNEQALINALKNNAVSQYICDTPSPALAKMSREDDQVICLPHLGASTSESERNCAVMASNQLIDFLQTGNIKNSVNYPTVEQPLSGATRICIANRNIPNVLSSVTSILGDHNANVANLSNKSRNDFAWTVIDIDSPVDDSLVNNLKQVNGVIRLRVMRNS